ncbi:MAG: hypothetical protein ACR2OR_14010 [Hyphomicrobiales bacterium]
MLGDPKSEVRQAGILGLEMLARDNLDDYFNPVQKVLCSFLCNGSAAHPAAIRAPANAVGASRELAGAHLPAQADYRTAIIALSRLCERARVRKLAVEGQFDLAGLGLKVGKRRRPPEKLPDAREIRAGPKLIDATVAGPTGAITETVQTIAPTHNDVVAARSKKLRKWKKEPALVKAAQPAAKTENVNAGPAQKGTRREVVIPPQPAQANPADEYRQAAKSSYAFAEPTGPIQNGSDADAAHDAAALLESLDETLEQIRLSLGADAREIDTGPAA